MFGLTPLGTAHTAISLIALFSGYWALLRDGKISRSNSLGKLYLWTTVITCVTGFGIFQHGGFGKPHALGLLTLIVLALTALPGGAKKFGHRWHYFVATSYTLTLFFHMVPGVTETFTRLPVGAPLFSGPEDPNLEKVVGVIFFAFAIGMVIQVYRLRKRQLASPTVAQLA